MKIYIYSKNSGEFLFSSDAQVNPKNKEEYIYPPNSTRVVPPSCARNEVALFNGEYWEKYPDFRGLEQINLDTMEITKVSSIGELKDGNVLYSEYVRTEEYKNYLRRQEALNNRETLLAEMRDLDKKRIRAICEPSVKDASTGETWLDYYNSEMVDLRQRLLEVDNDIEY